MDSVHIVKSLLAASQVSLPVQSMRTKSWPVGAASSTAVIVAPGVPNVEADDEPGAPTLSKSSWLLMAVNFSFTGLRSRSSAAVPAPLTSVFSTESYSALKMRPSAKRKSSCELGFSIASHVRSVSDRVREKPHRK